jgi:hypothetical protein
MRQYQDGEYLVTEDANGCEISREINIPLPIQSIDMQKQLTDIVQTYLDEAAQQKLYDGILSMCSYDNDPNPVFAAEATAAKKFRSDTWSHCHQVMDDVENGVREIPTGDELLAELPPVPW